MKRNLIAAVTLLAPIAALAQNQPASTDSLNPGPADPALRVVRNMLLTLVDASLRSADSSEPLREIPAARKTRPDRKRPKH